MKSYLDRENKSYLNLQAENLKLKVIKSIGGNWHIRVGNKILKVYPGHMKAFIQDGDLQSQARIRLSKDELRTDILSDG